MGVTTSLSIAYYLHRTIEFVGTCATWNAIDPSMMTLSSSCQNVVYGSGTCMTTDGKACTPLP